jgi:hypothetical protein
MPQFGQVRIAISSFEAGSRCQLPYRQRAG